MRVTIGLAAVATLCLLAGCNKGAANDSANAPAPTANVAAPVSPPAATPVPAANAAGGSSAMAECVAGVPRLLPPDTDPNAFCTCATSKTSSGIERNEAVNQCAAEMHITLRTQ